MITLFTYPGLYGTSDDNPYGLKLFAFMRLCGFASRQEHVFDARAAPRGQLSYIDDGLTDAQRTLALDRRRPFATPLEGASERATPSWCSLGRTAQPT